MIFKPRRSPASWAERAHLAQLAGDLLGLKNHGYPVQNFFIQVLHDSLNKF